MEQRTRYEYDNGTRKFYIEVNLGASAGTVGQTKKSIVHALDWDWSATLLNMLATMA